MLPSIATPRDAATCCTVLVRALPAPNIAGGSVPRIVSSAVGSANPMPTPSTPRPTATKPYPVSVRAWDRTASGLFAASLGLAVLSQARTDTGYGLVAVGLGVLGVGIGLALPTALDTILGTLPPAMLGAGNALTRTVQQVAASLGVAILGSILNGVYRAGIDGHINGLPAPSQAAAQASLAGAAAIAHSLPAPVNAALLKTASDAYVRGMADATLLSAAILMVVAILALRSQLVRVSADERPTRAGAPPSLVVLIVILFGAAV